MAFVVLLNKCIEDLLTSLGIADGAQPPLALDPHGPVPD